MSKRPSILRRLLSRIGAPFVRTLSEELRSLQGSIDELHGDLGRVHRDVEQARAHAGQAEADAARAAAIARHIYDEEPANRRRLHALRQSEDYELAFTEAEPLVSFLIPTYNSYETLRDVALPSILGQTYSNLEVLVVGDCAPPETAEAIAAIDDPRVSYFNRPLRGPYPEDPAKRWYVIGTPPYNEALSRARGRWIAGLGDDDAVRPDHVEALLAAARRDRLEHCYGRQEIQFAEGEPLVVGAFPPSKGQWGLQAAIFHAGLRFFELELSDAIYEEPNDWSMCRRMLRAGVRFGMVDRIVVDKHETRRRSATQWADGVTPLVE
jgi:cellulose synthase/poly-beta-1,6-N-acetylglucosamine synthase-like glycosyltransferase